MRALVALGLFLAAANAAAATTTNLKAIRAEIGPLKGFVDAVPVRATTEVPFLKGNINPNEFYAQLRASTLSPSQQRVLRAAYKESLPPRTDAETSRARIKHTLDVAVARLTRAAGKDTIVTVAEAQTTRDKTPLTLFDLARGK
jgi:hypothetical protein